MKVDPSELDYFPLADPWQPPKRARATGNGSGDEPPLHPPDEAPGAVSRFKAPIRFSPADPHVIADEAERAIIVAGFPVFHRGGALVEPSTEKVPTYGGGDTQITTLREINKARLIDFMSKASGWEKYNIREKKFLACAPPAIGAEILLERASEWSFPRVSGVITTPTLRRDGSILSAPGYDQETQLFHAADPNLQLPHMAEKPTMEEALRALAILEDLLTEFPFADKDSAVDKAVALSALMTPVIRAGIDAAPMHAIKAPEYGSGKSYLVNLSSGIASGAPCPVTTAGRDEEETDKRLDAALLKCQPIISLDNVNDVLCSDKLAVAVEQPMVSVRVLGLSKTIFVENKACIYATGCNITVRGDMVRRTLLCSIDPNEESPEKRTFKRDPYQEILADRGKYIAAAMTIARAYLAAGEPPVEFTKLVSFAAWSKFVQRPLIWLGCADPVQSVAASEDADPDRGAIAEVLASWHNSIGDESCTLKTIAAKAQARDRDDYSGGGFTNPDLREALMNIAPNRDGSLDTKKLAGWLRKNAGKIVGGMKVIQAGRDDHSQKVMWKVIKAKGLK
jgi:putative DNA primase/helicase